MNVAASPINGLLHKTRSLGIIAEWVHMVGKMDYEDAVFFDTARIVLILSDALQISMKMNYL